MTFVKNVWYVAAHVHELENDEPGKAMVSRTIAGEPVVMYRKA